MTRVFTHHLLTVSRVTCHRKALASKAIIYLLKWITPWTWLLRRSALLYTRLSKLLWKNMITKLYFFTQIFAGCRKLTNLKVLRNTRRTMKECGTFDQVSIRGLSSSTNLLYLADIFKALNSLNFQLQGKTSSIHKSWNHSKFCCKALSLEESNRASSGTRRWLWRWGEKINKTYLNNREAEFIKYLPDIEEYLEAHQNPLSMKGKKNFFNWSLSSQMNTLKKWNILGYLPSCLPSHALLLKLFRFSPCLNLRLSVKLFYTRGDKN